MLLKLLQIILSEIHNLEAIFEINQRQKGPFITILIIDFNYTKTYNVSAIKLLIFWNPQNVLKYITYHWYYLVP